MVAHIDAILCTPYLCQSATGHYIEPAESSMCETCWVSRPVFCRSALRPKKSCISIVLFVNWGWRKSWESSIKCDSAQPECRTPVYEINAWFALRIKKWCLQEVLTKRHILTALGKSAPNGTCQTQAVVRLNPAAGPMSGSRVTVSSGVWEQRNVSSTAGNRNRTVVLLQHGEFGEDCKLWSSSVRNFLRPPDIPLSTVCLCSFAATCQWSVTHH